MSEETIEREAANAAEKNADGHAKGKAKSENPAERKIREYFEANASEDLKARVAKSGKTAHGALEYAASRARKMAHSGNCVCVDDETVYGWCMHYFEDEDASSYEGKSTCEVATGESATPPKNGGERKERKPAERKAEKPAADDAQLCFDI